MVKRCIGIDIGSTSSDVVVLDGDFGIVISDYKRTKGKPVETLRGQLGSGSNASNALCAGGG